MGRAGPLVAGSLIDVEIRRFRAAAAGPHTGILGATDEELVSSDFVNDPRSAIVDLRLLRLAGDRLVRVVAGHANEWGSSHRLAKLLAFLAAREA